MDASSLSGGLWNYDVFISFRGEDVRETFVSHLDKALFSRGIITFKDDRRIKVGHFISDELCGAIRTSRFDIVVISENYATSRWCLDELQLIMEEEIEVVPIFYEVKPSDIRHERRNFALGKYQGSEMAEKVARWKKALHGVADIKGKESTECVDDATLIEEIVQSLSSRLLSILPINFRDIVGMKVHMEVLSPLLDMDSKDHARIIGISGTGGIGKTTIAKYLYEQLKLGFSHGHYFMENVAKLSGKHGLLHLQHQLLSNIFCDEKWNLQTVEHGMQQLEFRLRHVKVLLVLDDVDDVGQLNALAKEVGWFGPGSRIIITTRDKSLLNSCGVYDVKYLDDNKALQLFQWIAFEGDLHPSTEYKDLSIRVSRLALGLPLALKAFGFYLRRKSLWEWKKALKSFEEAPCRNIMKILNIIYDTLDELSKSAFLHVACLFNGEPVRRVMTLLDRGEVGIKILAEKSLIDISADGHIVMYSPLMQMGRDIVRQESGNNPAQKQILLHHYDIYQLLANKAGTTITEGVTIDVSRIPDDLHIEWTHFKPMQNLTFLKIYNYKPYTCLDSRRHRNLKGNLVLPCKLRLLHWDAYPFTTLHSIIHQDSLPKLQKLDLSNCDGLKNLRIIIEESEATIFQGRSLDVRSACVDFLDAEPLVKESRGTSLTNLSIKGNLEIKLKVLKGYAEHLSFTTEQQIPHQLMMLEQQKARLMSPPYGFKSLDIMRFNCDKKSASFKCCSFLDFPWLTELNLINLNIEEIPDDIHHMQVLEKLDLSGNDLRGLPTSMTLLSKLKHVTLCNCRMLVALPELYQLETLTLSDCTNLQALVNHPQAEQDQGRYSLLELRLDNCKNVKSLSDELRYFTKLTYLDISRHEFETVPPSIKDLSALVTLCLNYCSNLKSLTELPLSLKYLYAHGCMSLEASSFSADQFDHLDLSPCFQWNMAYSQITRFPFGRYIEKVPVCVCFQKNKTPDAYNQGTRSLISTPTQRSSSKTLKLVAFAMFTGVFACFRRWAIATKLWSSSGFIVPLIPLCL